GAWPSRGYGSLNSSRTSSAFLQNGGSCGRDTLT
ncbi:MAG: hypothetical protein AVDCRST_MAG86-860, partial [uncultured Truepera sp.]